MRFPIEKFLIPKNGDLEMKPEKPTKQTLKNLTCDQHSWSRKIGQKILRSFKYHVTQIQRWQNEKFNSENEKLFIIYYVKTGF